MPKNVNVLYSQCFFRVFFAKIVVDVPGYPVGGWVRRSAAELEVSVFTRTLNKASSRAA